MGGEDFINADSSETTELVSMDGDSKFDFSLSPRREDHCSIQVRLDTPQSVLSPPQVDEDTVVLTGGLHTSARVTEHSGLASGQVTSTMLPFLRTDRNDHACGRYTLAGEMVCLSS